MSKGGKAWTDRPLENAVGRILRVGVSAAAAVVALGGLIYLARHGAQPASAGLFQGEPDELRTVSGILRSALSLRGQGIIQLGLLLLVATPVARVAFAMLGFARERDRFYSAVAALVLALLLCSLFGLVPSG
ncbi:MAG: DUF1634 domain-containing protein [Elusimicrobia bacterium]|nr:DUF1634 domain-containing protein [Elusimicrobiota bacterium]